MQQTREGEILFRAMLVPSMGEGAPWPRSPTVRASGGCKCSAWAT